MSFMNKKPLDAVLGQCTSPEECFQTNVDGDYEVLASSRSKHLYVLKNGRIVAINLLNGFLRSLSCGTCGVDTEGDLTLLICTTSSGGVWCIPKQLLEDSAYERRQLSRRRPAGSPVEDEGDLKIKRDLGSPQPTITSDTSPPCNDEVFSSLLDATSGSNSKKSAACPSWDTKVPSFSDIATPVHTIATCHRTALISGACAAYALATRRLLVVSHRTDGLHATCYAFAEASQDTVRLSNAACWVVLFPGHTGPNDCRLEMHYKTSCAVNISASCLPNCVQMSKSFIEYSSSRLESLSGDVAYVVMAFGNGLVRCLPQQQDCSCDCSGFLLFDCGEEVSAILPVLLGTGQEECPNAMAFVCLSGRIVLFCPTPSSPARRPVIWKDVVDGPVVASCLVHCPSGNGTEVRDVMVCSNGLSVCCVTLPTLAQVIQDSVKTMSRHTLPFANVCSLWSSCKAGHAVARNRLGTLFEIKCPVASSGSAVPEQSLTRPSSDSMQEVLARLQSVSESLGEVQLQNDRLDAAVTALNQTLHIVKHLVIPGSGMLSRGESIEVRMIPKLTQERSTLQTASVECHFKNSSRYVLSSALTAIVSLVYSSSTCPPLPAWSTAIPLGQLSPGEQCIFKLPLLVHHVICCKVLVTSYLQLDMKALLEGVPHSSLSLGTPSFGLHSSEFDILSFSMPGAGSVVAAVASNCRQSYLQSPHIMMDVAHLTLSAQTATPHGRSSKPGSLKSLSLHVVDIPEHGTCIRKLLMEIFAVEFPVGRRQAFTIPGSDVFWLEYHDLNSHSEDDIGEKQRAPAADHSTPGVANIVMYSHSPVVLCSVHSALRRRLPVSVSGGDDGSSKPAESCIALRRRVELLRSKLQSLRDSFVEFQDHLSGAHPTRLTSAQVKARAAPFQERLWEVYSEMCSFPCT